MKQNNVLQSEDRAAETDSAAKLKAYLGFSLRSGKIALGADKIEEERRGVYLILADSDLGKTAMKRLKAASERFGAKLYLYKEKLGELLSIPAAKAAALKDKNLAKAAEGAVQASEKWNLYSEGEI